MRVTHDITMTEVAYSGPGRLHIRAQPHRTLFLNSGQPGLPFTPAFAFAGNFANRALMKRSFEVPGPMRPTYSMTTTFSVAVISSRFPRQIPAAQ